MKAVLLAVAVLVLTTTTVSARTWYIQPDGSGDAPTIQAGINSASAGDTVLVAAGTYFERDIGMKGGITLTSEGGPGMTVIDAGGSGSGLLCHNLPSDDTIIEGLTIRGAYDSGIESRYCSPLIRENIFVDNEARLGGGISCYYSSAEIKGNVFSGNTAREKGGAIRAYKGSPVIEVNTIETNTAQDNGGGIVLEASSAHVRNNVIRLNSAETGGGIHVRTDTLFWCYPVIEGNDISDNVAQYGGGIIAGGDYVSITIIDNLISGNTAYQVGGGVSWACKGGNPTSRIARNILTRNSAETGGAIYIRKGPQSLTVETNTLCLNQADHGGGMYCFKGAPVVSSNIVAFSSIGEGILCSLSDPTLACNDIYGNAGGDALCGADAGGNFSEDPLFCDLTGNDYYLQECSPCVDGYGCGQIGAYGIGCPCSNVPTEPTTWGAIKSIYR